MPKFTTPFIRPKFIKHQKVCFKFKISDSMIYSESPQCNSRKQFLVFGEVESSKFNSYDNPEKPTFYYEILPTAIAEKDLEKHPDLAGWLKFYTSREACGDFTITVEESKLSLVLD